MLAEASILDEDVCMGLRRLAVGFALAALAAAGCAHVASTLLPATAEPQRIPATTTQAAVWTQTDAVKVLPTTRPQLSNRTVAVSGARGETVDFQIIVTAKSAKSVAEIGADGGHRSHKWLWVALVAAGGAGAAFAATSLSRAGHSGTSTATAAGLSSPAVTIGTPTITIGQP